MNFIEVCNLRVFHAVKKIFIISGIDIAVNTTATVTATVTLTVNATATTTANATVATTALKSLKSILKK